MNRVNGATSMAGVFSPKTFNEMKAEPMTETELDKWLSGKRSRKILAVPFGGPLPSPHSKTGMDVDGEFFSERTDIFGPYPSLRANRERFVDWHHVTFEPVTHKDPFHGVMKGAVIGRMVLDAEPQKIAVDDTDYWGYWADMWANLGEKRRNVIGILERRLAPIYGSSQPVKGSVEKDPRTGEILVWPVQYHTLSTSPQNTFAVVPPLKAILDANLSELPPGALAALLAGLDALDVDVRTPSATGRDDAKAGRVLSARNEAALRRALEELGQVLSLLELPEQEAVAV